ncbi:MAG: SRPBCC domain-containing protein [Acidobacteriota bacterium]|nr:MAG: SRPBCC domain-containing protein [Acidobacteriota bacterium]
MPATLPELKMTRTIDAPVANVFQAWTDATLMKRWLAPHPYEVREAKADARPGGKYRIVVASADDGPHTTTGEYLEVEPDRRLVKTWFYEGPHGNDETPSVLTVDFREVRPGVTELTLTHAKLRDDEARGGASAGWALILDKLEALFEKE